MSASDERERRIRALLPLVRRIAKRVKRIVPGIDLDDLIGDGSVGLIRAVDSYDAERGTTLVHYARRLIAGAMLNGIRRMDPVSERARRTVRDAENGRYAEALVRGAVPAPVEVERRYPGYARASAAVHQGQPLSLDAPLPEGEALSVNWHDDPASVVQTRTANAGLHDAIARLPVRQRDLVLQHYFGERSLRAIARHLTISPQRASQLHLGALERLRKAACVAAY